MKTKMFLALIAGMIILCGPAYADFVTIGNPGNTADPATGYGAVGYVYQISKNETTIAEWSQFYNDSNSGKVGSFAVPNSYSYWNYFYSQGVDAPVSYVSIHQAAQYCNWLTTGSATTGAYSIDGTGAITAIDRTFRNTEGVLYVLPTENEWNKAAYYTGNSEDEWSLYAHGADTAPLAASTSWQYSNNGYIPTVARSAYVGAEEQNGTLNMMGNIREWVEWPLSGWVRARGGYYGDGPSGLQSTSYSTEVSPTAANKDYGFRVAVIPEPGAASILVLAGAVALIRRRIQTIRMRH